MHFTLEVLPNTRKAFNNFIESCSLQDLNKIPKGFNNNIIWNIGHIVVIQQILVYKLSGLPMLVSDALVDKYKRGSKPEGDVTQEDVNELKDLLFTTIDKTKVDYAKNVFKNFTPYTVTTTGNTLSSIDDAFNFVLFHEGLHFGYVLALLRAIKD
ncbi:DinB family protein [Mariniflexile aquimaris]|uniref:DinB family protein n=1 Tax=Mariniflexile aquimaris TaxID=881009 RepID=A0ABW3BNK5_9FLAO